MKKTSEEFVNEKKIRKLNIQYDTISRALVDTYAEKSEKYVQ
jgi:hypothetical protein